MHGIHFILNPSSYTKTSGKRRKINALEWISFKKGEYEKPIKLLPLNVAVNMDDISDLLRNNPFVVVGGMAIGLTMCYTLMKLNEGHLVLINVLYTFVIFHNN